jgi:hypothetical protein
MPSIYTKSWVRLAQPFDKERKDVVEETVMLPV